MRMISIVALYWLTVIPLWGLSGKLPVAAVISCVVGLLRIAPVPRQPTRGCAASIAHLALEN